VAEYPQAFNHVGLLVNGPFGRAELPFISSPNSWQAVETTNTSFPLAQLTQFYSAKPQEANPGKQAQGSKRTDGSGGIVVTRSCDTGRPAVSAGRMPGRLLARLWHPHCKRATTPILGGSAR